MIYGSVTTVAVTAEYDNGVSHYYYYYKKKIHGNGTFLIFSSDLGQSLTRG